MLIIFEVVASLAVGAVGCCDVVVISIPSSSPPSSARGRQCLVLICSSMPSPATSDRADKRDRGRDQMSLTATSPRCRPRRPLTCVINYIAEDILNRGTVKSDVAAQERSLKHEPSGKPGKLWEADLTALYLALGSCIRAGHSRGLGTGQAIA
ncbi:hypothetical protein MUK42_17207 [Musa troglodytarum]|uniref:Uncharacterized protein n=1 Tax=Musa troglodytarum TaxID=320322 RepID=A0A9E7HIM1_9LILI|nr:hypothetical protein MUK42_17207 [Musa troglodytarum]